MGEDFGLRILRISGTALMQAGPQIRNPQSEIFVSCSPAGATV